MWQWVGGSTSVTSAAGLLPAALQAVDVAALLSGAAAMDEATRAPEVARNPAALLAFAWYRETERKGRKEMAVLPYRDRLALFPLYLQQLVTESLGKGTNLAGRAGEQGITVRGARGSTDQHALFQQLREGAASFFVTFLEVAKDREDGQPPLPEGSEPTPGDTLLGCLLGARRSLAEKGRASITVTLPDVSPRSVGMLIALFERTVGLHASLVGINAYHQAGVEAGRTAAAVGAEAETEMVFKILSHLSANPGHGVTRRDGPTPFDATFGLA